MCQALLDIVDAAEGKRDKVPKSCPGGTYVVMWIDRMSTLTCSVNICHMLMVNAMAKIMWGQK